MTIASGAVACGSGHLTRLWTTVMNIISVHQAPSKLELPEVQPQLCGTSTNDDNAVVGEAVKPTRMAHQTRHKQSATLGFNGCCAITLPLALAFSICMPFLCSSTVGGCEESVPGGNALQFVTQASELSTWSSPPTKTTDGANADVTPPPAGGTRSGNHTRWLDQPVPPHWKMLCLMHSFASPFALLLNLQSSTRVWAGRKKQSFIAGSVSAVVSRGRSSMRHAAGHRPTRAHRLRDLVLFFGSVGVVVSATDVAPASSSPPLLPPARPPPESPPLPPPVAVTQLYELATCDETQSWPCRSSLTLEAGETIDLHGETVALQRVYHPNCPNCGRTLTIQSSSTSTGSARPVLQNIALRIGRFVTLNLRNVELRGAINRTGLDPPVLQADSYAYVNMAGCSPPQHTYAYVPSSEGSSVYTYTHSFSGAQPGCGVLLKGRVINQGYMHYKLPTPPGHWLPLTTNLRSCRTNSDGYRAVDSLDTSSDMRCVDDSYRGLQLPTGTWPTLVGTDAFPPKCASGAYAESFSNSYTSSSYYSYVYLEPLLRSRGFYVDSICSGYCAAGYFCPEGTTTPIPCPPGTFSNVSRLGSSLGCIVCPRGASCPGNATTLPTVCPQDTFQDQAGQTACRPCDPDKFCSRGSFVQLASLCEPGYYYTDNNRDSSPAFDASLDCTICSPGYQCSGVRQTPCIPGTTQSLNGSASCVDCAAGKYMPDEASSTSECTPCPPGSYCLLASSKPTPCPPGFYGPSTGLQDITECVICPRGFSCSGGLSEPESCAPGSQSVHLGDSVCTGA